MNLETIRDNGDEKLAMAMQYATIKYLKGHDFNRRAAFIWVMLEYAKDFDFLGAIYADRHGNVDLDAVNN